MFFTGFSPEQEGSRRISKRPSRPRSAFQIMAVGRGLQSTQVKDVRSRQSVLFITDLNNKS